MLEFVVVSYCFDAMRPMKEENERREVRREEVDGSKVMCDLGVMTPMTSFSNLYTARTSTHPHP
jgi:hypothetical protein